MDGDSRKGENRAIDLRKRRIDGIGEGRRENGIKRTARKKM